VVGTGGGIKKVTGTSKRSPTTVNSIHFNVKIILLFGSNYEIRDDNAVRNRVCSKFLKLWFAGADILSARGSI
jgi:hypothetical protein